MTDRAQGKLSRDRMRRIHQGIQQHAAERKAKRDAARMAERRKQSERERRHASDPDVQTYQREVDASKARRDREHAKLMADAKAMWDRQQAQDGIRTKGGRRRRPFYVVSRDPLEIDLPEFRRTA